MNRITYFVFVMSLLIAVVNGKFLYVKLILLCISFTSHIQSPLVFLRLCFHTGYNLRGFSDTTDGHRNLKYNAAQKRQNQRDRRRFNFNPGRTWQEEERERWRKHTQAAKIGRPRKDPYEPNRGDRYYARKREVARSNRCRGTGGGGLFGGPGFGGRDCNYVALNWDVGAGPGSQNHGERDYDPIHDKDYYPGDYGIGNSWWP